MNKVKAEELYEVFRVDSGIALFIEDHLERLYSGAIKAGINLKPDKPELLKILGTFINKSDEKCGNIRLSFYFDPKTRNIINFETRFISHHYPEKYLYTEGISCRLLLSERRKPQTKLANPDLRQKANDIIEKENAYEVLLVNKNGKITEGSRSNVFFIKDNCLITAPSDMVLPGVIRKKTIQLAQKYDIKLSYRCIDVKNDLHEMEAAFITGTSPRILPIKSVEDVNFNPSNPIIKCLMKVMNQLIEQYIKDKKV